MEYDFSLSPVGIAIMALTAMYNTNYATTNRIGVLWASDTEYPALLPVASSVASEPSTSRARMILHVEVLDPDLLIRTDLPLRWFSLPNPSVNGAVGGAVFFRPSTKNPLNPSFSKMLGPDMCSLLGANGSVLAMLFDAQGVAIDATETDIPVVCNALCSAMLLTASELIKGVGFTKLDVPYKS